MKKTNKLQQLFESYTSTLDQLQRHMYSTDYQLEVLLKRLTAIENSIQKENDKIIQYS